ncbi:MAG TPA: TolC family protein [Paludibaculum sp.]
MRTRIVWLSLLALSASAQEPLTLKDAVRQALGRHPSLDAATARVQASEARIGQARSGRLPRVQYLESFQSGNNPVYVFGSLLTQRQFTAANFALDPLNRPDPLNNFQSQVVAEQLVYDFGGIKNSIRAAELGKQMTEQEKKSAELSLVAAVARAYHGVSLATQALEVAKSALLAAEADQKRAETVRSAGMATDADVLSVQVHVAMMREQVIRRSADVRVGLAALNEALGLPLDTPHQLTTPLTPVLGAAAGEALARPELQQMKLARDAADAQALSAHAGYLPQFGLRGVLEADRQNFVTKGGGNWMFMASMKWNLFDGGRTRQNVAEAKAMSAVAQANERQYTSAIQLEVRKARADFESATERIAVTEATIAQADESLRILRNRYSNGLATITDVLRAQTASLDAKMRRLGAIHDQRLAALDVERAAGILNGDSNVLQ